mgnify:FL=1
MDEFAFIDQYLKSTKAPPAQAPLILGIGDDAATFKIAAHRYWHMSVDTLVEGKHFFSNDNPDAVAYKSLAVNISDIAAMGALPKWILLALSAPALDSAWFNPYFGRFYATLNEQGMALVGGNIAASDERIINITIVGESDHPGLRRSAAQIGDDIWVTGKIGLAIAALYHHWGKAVLSKKVFAQCEQARTYPPPRAVFMNAIANQIHAAEDISDGLVQDLGHILEASQVAAEIHLEAIPTLDALYGYECYPKWLLNGGDDYEILFTAPEKARTFLERMSEQEHTPICRLGCIQDGKGIKVWHKGELLHHLPKGFDHFRL